MVYTFAQKQQRWFKYKMNSIALGVEAADTYVFNFV